MGRRTTLKWITYHPRRAFLAGFGVFNKPASSKTKHSNARRRRHRRARFTRARSSVGQQIVQFVYDSPPSEAAPIERESELTRANAES